MSPTTHTARLLRLPRLVPAAALSALLAAGAMPLPSPAQQIAFPGIVPLQNDSAKPAASTAAPSATTTDAPPAIKLPASAQAKPDPKRDTQPTELRSEKLEMWSTDTETHAIATGSVILTATNLKITCDRLEIIATRIGGDTDEIVGTLERFKYLLATGRVRIQQDDREATCGRAEVFPREEKVVLSEAPVLVDHSNGIITTAERMVLLRGQKAIHGDMVRIIGPAIQDLGANATKNAAEDAAKNAPKTDKK
ncbi:hypothetical protein Ga0100231_007575 [Opitutaceae bacterium TAV4]|uniref:LptA/OstA family protein n=1 Tax=Geminisphaera colitermitum TaxID=1148786 RepID=UPI000158CE6A|nr:hypothetical protein [Geminisphaera colitermitum]RRJ94242.1 hypothetical protein Ga0100231_007575 [Opitutaceae bacterium TAV4]RRJ98333.1 hypothetical protein Ga0100230_007845 [Opitutaceae bacterium TAV3]